MLNRAGTQAPPQRPWAFGARPIQNRAEAASPRDRAERLIMRTCTGIVPEAHRESVSSLVDEPVDWTHFLVLAAANRVLIGCVGALEADYDLPPAVLSTRDYYRRQVQSDVARVKRRFEDLLPKMSFLNRIILLRGVAYACGRPTQAATRRIGDLDILIDEPAVMSLGGVSGDHFDVPAEIIAAARGEVVVEFHHDLNVSSRFGRHGASMNMAEFWARSTDLVINGLKVGLLSPEDNIIYLSFHNIVHRFELIYRFVDMIQIIKENNISWDEVVGRSRRYGLTRALWLNLTLLDRLHPGIVPSRIIALVAPTWLLRRLILRFVNDGRILKRDEMPGAGSRFTSLLNRVRNAPLVYLSLVRPTRIHHLLLQKLVVLPVTQTYTRLTASTRRPLLRWSAGRRSP